MTPPSRVPWGALLRREGFVPHMWWRRWPATRAGRCDGQFLGPRAEPEQTENERLRRDNDRLRRELAKTQAALDVVGKAHALLELALRERTPRSGRSGDRPQAVAELAGHTSTKQACELRGGPGTPTTAPAGQLSRRRSVLDWRRRTRSARRRCAGTGRAEQSPVRRQVRRPAATLLDEVTYLLMSTMHRLLRRSRAGRRAPPPGHPSGPGQTELLATAPQQVWSWDITKPAGRPAASTTTCT